MDKRFLKKIIAQSPEDLQIISACCSEAKVSTSEIKYLPSNKIFLLSILRFDKENENNKKSIHSIIKFEFIESSKSKNIDQNSPKILMELIAIDVFKKEHNFEITLLFSKNRFMHVAELRRLGAKIIVKGNKAIIEGQTEFIGAELMSSDLRASVALVLAAMVAKGQSIINRIII